MYEDADKELRRLQESNYELAAKIRWYEKRLEDMGHDKLTKACAEVERLSKIVASMVPKPYYTKGT